MKGTCLLCNDSGKIQYLTDREYQYKICDCKNKFYNMKLFELIDVLDCVEHNYEKKEEIIQLCAAASRRLYDLDSEIRQMDNMER